MPFVIYQHINPNTKEVFYIGSGKLGREKETGVIQRGQLYNLYVTNNNLVSYLGLYREVNIIIEVLETCNTKSDAMQIENDLIVQNYGKPGYKLVNTQTKFIHDEESLIKRTKAVKLAVQKKVIHIETNTVYESITAMAKNVNIERVTLQKRIAVVKRSPDHRFSDEITPCYAE